MESVLRRTEMDLDTQNPPTRKLSSFSSYIPRRIHLDSSSYRSLVRILSHSFNHSLVPLSPAPERTLSVKDPILSLGRGERHQDPEEGANTDVETSAERREGARRADGGVQGVLAAGAELIGLDVIDFDEKEIEACVNSEELRSVMLECGRLIDAPTEEPSAESHEGNEQTVLEEIVHNELEIARPLVNSAEERVSHLREVSKVTNRDEKVYNSLNAVDVGNPVISEPADGTDYKNAILVETQNENSKGAEEKGEDKKLLSVYPTSLVDFSGLRNFKDDQVCTLRHQIDGAEVEEGEIFDGTMDLEGLVDINNGEKVPEDKRKESPSSDGFIEAASTAICIHKKEATELGVSLLDTSAREKKMKKKKNTSLTEERKAKKKIAKKRKKAQKNREQGVKKLKLHAIVKPKEVRYCNFYRMGRCQQGDLCKFSHDTTPSTKSMPCRYFACNSCLRGDDCPYDHELSKYPCLNYMSTGSCNRGDLCKFSHKIPTTDAGTHTFPPDIASFENKTNEALPLRYKPLKEANRVPKGIRFISFGTVQKELTNKVEESLPANKSYHTGAYNLQMQDDLLARGHQSAYGFTVKESGNVTKGMGSSVTHAGGTANHEVSEATKILEEFLFCGAGFSGDQANFALICVWQDPTCVIPIDLKVHVSL